MARVFKSDPNNTRRLVVGGMPDHTLRGFLVNDGDTTITTTVEWGPSPSEDGRPHIMCFTTIEWPGGAQLARVVRPWRRGGDWHACWNETRRQVRDISGIDIGDPPHAGSSPGGGKGEDGEECDAALVEVAE